MPLDLSNEYLRNAVAFLALFAPILFSTEVFKVYYQKAERTTRTYVLMGTYLVVSFVLYAFVLDGKPRLFSALCSAMLLGVFFAGHFFNLLKGLVKRHADKRRYSYKRRYANKRRVRNGKNPNQ